jgi:AcrR family transcriptional regulator
MASARQLFLRRGFHAASLEQVAEEAGFTIGAVYSRFGTKADLFLAILDEHIDRLVAEVDRVAGLDQPLGDHAERLADPARVPEGLLSTMAVSFLRGVAADGPTARRRS